jgi:hypothetical protein
MKPQSALAHKGDSVEEWSDVHFFRPLGMMVVSVLVPTRVSADTVTLWSVVCGMIAGHLMFYQNVTVNLLGVALFIFSDVLDSADGQLARLRGTSSRFGRTLDGIADGLRFLSLYLHLIARMVAAHFGWQGVGLVLAAGVSHSLQLQVVDFVKNAYLRLGEGTGEVDLPEEIAAPSGPFFRRLAEHIYRGYVRRQDRFFPRSMALLRAVAKPGTVAFREAYAAAQGPLLGPLALISQNIRFILLAVGAVWGMHWFLWIEAVPMNLVAAYLLMRHERGAGAMLEGVTAVPVRP